ncbi:hypothetical protein BH23ACT9_BH23ACT9_34070 [soil metagenome]
MWPHCARDRRSLPQTGDSWLLPPDAQSVQCRLVNAILRGADLPDLGVVDVRTPAPDVAIALTRGQAAKRYEHVDPNEDVVAVDRRDGRTALIVADGHNGHQASHAAVDALLSQMQPEIPLWSRVEAVRSFHAVNEHIREVRRPLPPSHRGTRTTLTAAVVAIDEHGQRYVTHCSVGDSAVVVVRDGSVHQLTRDRHRFLGDALTAPLLAGVIDYEQTDLDPDDVVVLFTDGYSNFAPLDAISGARDPDPEVMARRIVAIAGEGGAGDNVAVAVLAAPAAMADRDDEPTPIAPTPPGT